MEEGREIGREGEGEGGRERERERERERDVYCLVRVWNVAKHIHGRVDCIA